MIKRLLRLILRPLLWAVFLPFSICFYLIFFMFFSAWIFLYSLVSAFERSDLDVSMTCVKNPEELIDRVQLNNAVTSEFAIMAQSQMSKFNSTRDIEWRMNFAVWGFFAVTMATSLASHRRLEEWQYIFFGVIICAGHFAWLLKIQRSEDVDLFFFRAYRYASEKIMANSLIADPKLVPFENWPKPFGWLLGRDWMGSSFVWVLVDSIITVFFFIFSFVILYHPK